jgi:hypothetical protein
MILFILAVRSSFGSGGGGSKAYHQRQVAFSLAAIDMRNRINLQRLFADIGEERLM